MTIATLPARAATAAARTRADAVRLPVELLEELGSGAAPASADTRDADRLGAGFDALQSEMQTWLRHWDPVPLPAFTAVRDVTPESERGPSALRAAATRDDGAVRVTASLYDPPGRLGGALGWSRNWATSAVLPAAPEAGRLFYRFRVSSRLLLDGRAALSLISTSVNFGIVADAAKANPFEARGFATPIARPLVGVQAREDAVADATQAFEGSIAVRQGDTPALAFVIGTDVLFQDGWVRVHEGSSTWIGSAEPGASGTVEVRYVPAAMLRFFDRTVIGG